MVTMCYHDKRRDCEVFHGIKVRSSTSGLTSLSVSTHRKLELHCLVMQRWSNDLKYSMGANVTLLANLCRSYTVNSL